MDKSLRLYQWSVGSYQRQGLYFKWLASQYSSQSSAAHRRDLLPIPHDGDSKYSPPQALHLCSGNDLSPSSKHVQVCPVMKGKIKLLWTLLFPPNFHHQRSERSNLYVCASSSILFIYSPNKLGWKLHVPWGACVHLLFSLESLTSSF